MSDHTPTTVKCDGNHAGPRCADPECWNDEPTTAPALGKLLTMSEQDVVIVAMQANRDDIPEATRIALKACIAEIVAQKRQVATLTEDRERIEWLEQQAKRAGFTHVTFWAHDLIGMILEACSEDHDEKLGHKAPTVREAIDAARKEQE